jgi:penicillin amidase
LPSIWYEAHLVVPGALDAYGVTIPGAPSIIIGFNRDVAWTFTNTESDVLDRYVETVDDDARPTQYKLDGKFRPLVMRTEIYRDPNGRVIATDTIRWTHRGPMRRVLDRWISARWTAADSSLNTSYFELAQHARSAAEFMADMAPYTAPAQNMLAVDRSGTIAIRSTGAFPLRPGNGRGDLLRDGSTSKSDWTGFWPLAKYPQSVNPSRGYLSSNNQQPIDPLDNPRYLGSRWFAPWRAIRINELMRADANVTMDDMRRWQTDPHSARAEYFVPALLAAARARPADSAAAEGARYLSQWSRTYTEDDQRAILFEYAMNEVTRRVWDELRDSTGGRRLAAPDGTVLAELMQQPKNVWWDDRATPKVVETRDDILAQSLGAAYKKVVKDFGDADDGGWRWGGLRHANIYHLLRIPALSALLVPSQGGPSTLNPLGESGTFGPSWRMVVEMGPEVHAMGTYPGGQSGNPASARYLEHLVTWSKGELDTLRFPKSEADLDRRTITSVLTLTPAAK